MELGDIIKPEGIILELAADKRDGVYVEMVEHLVSGGLLPADLKKSALKGLNEREEKMTTAIGGGVCLPHADIPGIVNVVSGIGLSKEGVDCEAVDGKKVNVFYMILVPRNQYSLHLRALALVARFFNQPGIRENLLNAKTPEEVYELLKKKPVARMV